MLAELAYLLQDCAYGFIGMFDIQYVVVKINFRLNCGMSLEWMSIFLQFS